MAGIFSAFTDAQAAGQAFGDSVTASKDLQQAMQDTPKDSTGQADLFTTYQKAGQMAMQSGNTRVADSFLKKANEYKGAALEQKLNEMKVQDEQLSRFEQHIQGLETADEIKQSLMSSDVPTDQKMRLMPLIDKDPKKFKEMMLEQVVDGKTRLAANQKTLALEAKIDYQNKLLDIRADQVRNQANKANNNPKQTPAEKLEDALTLDQGKRLQSEVDKIDDEAAAKIDNITENIGKKNGLSPEQAKKNIAQIEGAAKIRRAKAQQKLDEFREGLKSGKTDSKKTDTIKTKAPAYNDWLKAAKEKNPTASEADLKAFYEKKYKE